MAQVPGPAGKLGRAAWAGIAGGTIPQKTQFSPAWAELVLLTTLGGLFIANWQAPNEAPVLTKVGVGVAGALRDPVGRHHRPPAPLADLQ